MSFWYFVGIDLRPGAAPTDVEVFDDFYRDVHAPEVVRENPGFSSCRRWRLIESDSRGGSGPARLACYTLSGSGAVDAYLERPRRPHPAAPVYSPKPGAWRRATRPMWRSFWRTALTWGDVETPGTVALAIGAEVPPDATRVTEAYGFTWCVQLDLYQDLGTGAPAHCAFFGGGPTGPRNAPRRPDGDAATYPADHLDARRTSGWRLWLALSDEIAGDRPVR